jgi:hypothetical protein
MWMTFGANRSLSGRCRLFFEPMEVWVADVDVTREHVFLLLEANGSLRCRCRPRSVANRKMCFRRLIDRQYATFITNCIHWEPSSQWNLHLVWGVIALCLTYMSMSIVPNITELFSQLPPLLTMEGEVAFDWRCSSDQQVSGFLKEHSIFYFFQTVKKL